MIEEKLIKASEFLFTSYGDPIPPLLPICLGIGFLLLPFEKILRKVFNTYGR